MLGKLQPDLFPPVFGPNADECLDRAVVEERFHAVTAEVNAAFPDLPPKSVYEVATGFLTIGEG